VRLRLDTFQPARQGVDKITCRRSDPKLSLLSSSLSLSTLTRRDSKNSLYYVFICWSSLSVLYHGSIAHPKHQTLQPILPIRTTPLVSDVHSPPTYRKPQDRRQRRRPPHLLSSPHPLHAGATTATALRSHFMGMGRPLTP